MVFHCIIIYCFFYHTVIFYIFYIVVCCVFQLRGEMGPAAWATADLPNSSAQALYLSGTIPSSCVDAKMSIALYEVHCISPFKRR